MRKFTALLLVFMLSVGLLSACSMGSKEASRAPSYDNAYGSAPASAPAPTIMKGEKEMSDSAAGSGFSNVGDIGSSVVGEKIIRSGNMSLEVQDLEATVKEIEEIIAAEKGSVLNLNVFDVYSGRRAEISLRVPAEGYSSLHGQILPLGKVTQDQVYTEDVTEEYIDLAARLEVLESSKDAYTDLMTKAKNVEEVITVKRELDRVVMEIESVKGRLRYLNTRVDYSYFYINLFERSLTEVESEGFFTRLRNALAEGFNTMLDVTISLISFMVSIIPLIALGIVLVMGIVRLRRRFKKNKVKKTPVPEVKEDKKE